MIRTVDDLVNLVAEVLTLTASELVVSGRGSARLVETTHLAVLAHAAPTSPTVASLERAVGRAAVGKRATALFTVAPVDPAPLRYAEDVGLAVFVVDLAGAVKAETDPALDMLDRFAADADVSADTAATDSPVSGEIPFDPESIHPLVRRFQMLGIEIGDEPAVVHAVKVTCPACGRTDPNVVLGDGSECAWCQCGTEIDLATCGNCSALFLQEDTELVDAGYSEEEWCVQCASPKGTCDLCERVLPEALLSESDLVGGLVTVNLCTRCPDDWSPDDARAVMDRLRALAKAAGVHLPAGWDRSISFE